MNGIEFRSCWELHLFKWISEHWDEIALDEWVLHDHILELIRLNTPPIQRSIFHHKSEYEGNQKILKVAVDFLYKDEWYNSSFPVRADINNAYRYNPREGF
tara:strand:+ start:113 stop:415 length:303 start_codon:yes stop_codon:yes gene_type:complete